MRNSFADKIVFALLLGWAFLILMYKFGQLNKVVLGHIFLIFIALVLAMLVALVNHIPYKVSLLGFWQIWRAHIAIIIGLILVMYIKKIPTWPIIAVLQFNMIFSLMQPMLGEGVMAVLYPVGYMEYRSGILRSVGIFGSPNSNALFLALYVLFLWRQLLNREGGRYIKPILFLSILALFTTGSRTSILITPLLMVYMAWSIKSKGMKENRKIKISLSTSLIGLILVVGLGGFLVSQEKKSTSMGYSLIPDIALISNTENLGEGYFRAVASAMAIGRFFEHPIIGLGYGTYGTPASFSWPSPYLQKDGLLIPEDSRGFKLSQLDVLAPVILAESGLLGAILWILGLWKLLNSLIVNTSENGSLFKVWIIILLISTMSGAGITHPVIVVILPFVMMWLLKKNTALKGGESAAINRLA
jgi:hypothetical protein